MFETPTNERTRQAIRSAHEQRTLAFAVMLTYLLHPVRLLRQPWAALPRIRRFVHD